jgi:hypothetical protein
MGHADFHGVGGIHGLMYVISMVLAKVGNVKKT